MSTYCVIENNVVVNVIIAEPEFIQEHGNEIYGQTIECVEGSIYPSIGWRLVDGELVPPERDLDGEWENIRKVRNERLVESDLLVLPDLWDSYSSSEKTAISNYRKDLRDIPQTFFHPDDIIWPLYPIL